MASAFPGTERQLWRAADWFVFDRGLMSNYILQSRRKRAALLIEPFDDRVAGAVPSGCTRAVGTPHGVGDSIGPILEIASESSLDAAYLVVSCSRHRPYGKRGVVPHDLDSSGHRARLPDLGRRGECPIGSYALPAERWLRAETVVDDGHAIAVEVREDSSATRNRHEYVRGRPTHLRPLA